MVLFPSYPEMDRTAFAALAEEADHLQHELVQRELAGCSEWT